MSIPTEEKVKRRLPRKERERLIIDEAIRFFAEVGFEGQTRALAQRLGVTQPLLYRYFPDKDALIERVYREVFVDGWDESWEKRLVDRSRPLAARLREFYVGYAQANMNYERVRLFMFASLKDKASASHYLHFIREHLLLPLVREIRHEAGLDPAQIPSDAEVECVAGLHGAVGYVGMRRWVYETPVNGDVNAIIDALISTFLQGAPAAFRQLSQLN